jgi:hypothetical protein
MGMQISIHEDPEILRRLDAIQASLARIEAKETAMAGELDALATQVAANTDAEASAIAVLGQLHDLLVAAGTDPNKLAALKDQLATSQAALAAAIVANTPAVGKVG